MRLFGTCRVVPAITTTLQRSRRRGRIVTVWVAGIATIAAAAPIAEAATPAVVPPVVARQKTGADLPLLQSDPLAAPSLSVGSPGVATTAADLARGPQPGDSKSVPVAELGDRRGAKSRVFRNDDSSLTLDEYSTPINYQTADGTWIPIDNALRPVASRPGWVATSGNQWTAAFGPLSQGVELSTPAGTVRMTPVAADKTPLDAAEPAVSSATRTAGPRLVKDEAAESAVPAPSTVHYRTETLGADLRYEVRSNGVKEDIVLKDSSASPTYSFDLAGTDLTLAKNGSVRLSGKIGEQFSIPAPTVATADGTDMTGPSGVHYEVSDPNGARDGMRLTVAVDSGWLVKQPATAFPLVIDPTFWAEAPDSAVSYSSAGGSYAGVQIGRDSSGNIWRGAMHFPAYESYLSGGYRAYYAFIEFVNAGGASGNTKHQPV